jgi:hypothetical protein
MEVWREEAAPVDQTLFISMSSSIAIDADQPSARQIAKTICRKVLREGWLPLTVWDMEGKKRCFFFGKKFPVSFFFLFVCFFLFCFCLFLLSCSDCVV